MGNEVSGSTSLPAAPQVPKGLRRNNLGGLDDWPVPPMVLYIESLALPEIHEKASSRKSAPFFASVLFDGDLVSNGHVFRLPSGPIELRPRTHGNCIQIRLYRDDQGLASSQLDSAPSGEKSPLAHERSPKRVARDALADLHAHEGPNQPPSLEAPSGDATVLPRRPWDFDVPHAAVPQLNLSMNSQHAVGEVRLYAEIACSISKLVRYGTPLYTSLWLGMRQSSSPEEGTDDLDAALARARSPWMPKIKITLFRPIEDIKQKRAAARTPLSSPRGNTFSSQGNALHLKTSPPTTPRSGQTDEAPRAEPDIQTMLAQKSLLESDLWDYFAHLGNKDFRIAMVEGLIRCLEESNATIQSLQVESNDLMGQFQQREDVRQIQADRDALSSDMKSFKRTLAALGFDDLVSLPAGAALEAVIARKLEEHDHSLDQLRALHKQEVQSLRDSHADRLAKTSDECERRLEETRGLSQQQLEDAAREFDQRLHDANEAASAKLQEEREEHERRMAEVQADIERITQESKDAKAFYAAQLEEVEREAEAKLKRELEAQEHRLAEAQESATKRIEKLAFEHGASLQEARQSAAEELDKLRNELQEVRLSAAREVETLKGACAAAEAALARKIEEHDRSLDQLRTAHEKQIQSLNDSHGGMLAKLSVEYEHRLEEAKAVSHQQLEEVATEFEQRLHDANEAASAKLQEQREEHERRMAEALAERERITQEVAREAEAKLKRELEAKEQRLAEAQESATKRIEKLAFEHGASLQEARQSAAEELDKLKKDLQEARISAAREVETLKGERAAIEAAMAQKIEEYDRSLDQLRAAHEKHIQSLRDSHCELLEKTTLEHEYRLEEAKGVFQQQLEKATNEFEGRLHDANVAASSKLQEQREEHERRMADVLAEIEQLTQELNDAKAFYAAQLEEVASDAEAKLKRELEAQEQRMAEAQELASTTIERLNIEHDAALQEARQSAAEELQKLNKELQEARLAAAREMETVKSQRAAIDEELVSMKEMARQAHEALRAQSEASDVAQTKLMTRLEEERAQCERERSALEEQIACLTRKCSETDANSEMSKNALASEINARLAAEEAARVAGGHMDVAIRDHAEEREARLKAEGALSVAIANLEELEMTLTQERGARAGEQEALELAKKSFQDELAEARRQAEALIVAAKETPKNASGGSGGGRPPHVHPLEWKPDRVCLRVFRTLFDSVYTNSAEEEFIKMFDRVIEGGTAAPKSKFEVTREIRRCLYSKREFDVRKAFRKFDSKRTGQITAVHFHEYLSVAMPLLSKESMSYIYFLIDAGVRHSRPDRLDTSSHMSPRTSLSVSIGSAPAGTPRVRPGAGRASVTTPTTPRATVSVGVRARSPGAAPGGARASGRGDGAISEDEFVKLFTDARLEHG